MPVQRMHLGMFCKLQLHMQFPSPCTTCACLSTGTLYRESGVVSGITNRRWAALFPHCVATFRKEGSKEPSKVWPLSPRCQLSKIKSKEFMVREKHTSTIWALAAGHYDRKCMVRLQSIMYTIGPQSHTSLGILERCRSLATTVLAMDIQTSSVLHSKDNIGM